MWAMTVTWQDWSTQRKTCTSVICGHQNIPQADLEMKPDLSDKGPAMSMQLLLKKKIASSVDNEGGKKHTEYLRDCHVCEYRYWAFLRYLDDI